MERVSCRLIGLCIFCFLLVLDRKEEAKNTKDQFKGLFSIKFNTVLMCCLLVSIVAMVEGLLSPTRNGYRCLGQKQVSHWWCWVEAVGKRMSFLPSSWLFTGPVNRSNFGTG